MGWLTKKLKALGGESLIETLVAILVVAVTSSILVMYVQASAKINGDAKIAFEIYAQQMSAAEARTQTGETTIKLNGTDVDVYYSGDIAESQIHSYWR